VILLLTYLLVAVAIQAFAGFEETGLGPANEEDSDDVLTVVGEPVFGAVMASVLLLTVAISAASSTQTTILPTARGTLAMTVYGAIPERFAHIHPRGCCRSSVASAWLLPSSSARGTCSIRSTASRPSARSAGSL
jgi:amino acid transporter